MICTIYMCKLGFQVSVDVGSVSNQKPVFQSESYEASVSENATAGTVVIQVVANDPDGDDKNLR